MSMHEVSKVMENLEISGILKRDFKSWSHVKF